MNNTGLMMNPQGTAGQPPSGPGAVGDHAAPSGPGADANHSTDPVLARLKQLEEANASFQSALDQSKSELKMRDERIEFLSADKRREMQELIDSGIERWLNSLTGVSPESKKQFKDGVQDIAKKADASNAAWEIVCNASQTHDHNVKEIERLIQLDESNRKTINELRGFKSEASRIGTTPHAPNAFAKREVAEDGSRNVRMRLNDDTTVPPAAAAGPRDSWSDFASMMNQDLRTNYYR
jgi:hypothetical protein